MGPHTAPSELKVQKGAKFQEVKQLIFDIFKFDYHESESLKICAARATKPWTPISPSKILNRSIHVVIRSANNDERVTYVVKKKISLEVQNMNYGRASRASEGAAQFQLFQKVRIGLTNVEKLKKHEFNFFASSKKLNKT